LRTNLIDSLKECAPTGTGSSNHTWLRSVFVVSEVAIALVLLIVSGAFLRSFQKMRAVDPGYRPDHVLVAQYQLPSVNIPPHLPLMPSTAHRRSALEQTRSRRCRHHQRLARSRPFFSICIHDRGRVGRRLEAEIRSVRDYLRRLLQCHAYSGIRWPNLYRGRRIQRTLVAIVNQSMARHSWPGQRAIGKRMHIGTRRRGCRGQRSLVSSPIPRSARAMSLAPTSGISRRSNPPLLPASTPREAHQPRRWIHHDAFNSLTRAHDLYSALDRR